MRNKVVKAWSSISGSAGCLQAILEVTVLVAGGSR